MDRDELIIAGFCLIDEALPVVTAGQRLRQRGPHSLQRFSMRLAR
jgi:hypothetical protein